MNINFIFSVGDEVLTSFNEIGIITMAAVDKEGRQYFVKTKQSDQWFWETLLKPNKHSK